MSILVHAFRSYNSSTPSLVFSGHEECDYHTVHPRFISTGASFRICLRPNDLIGRVIKGKDGYWPECKHFLHFWNHHLLGGEIFLDVGANIGSCSLLMAANRIPVISFEPIPSNLYFFVESLRANKDFNVSVYPFGASASQDRKVIFAEEGNWGNSMIGKPANPNKRQHNFTINLTPLDDVLWPDKTLPPPAIGLMKLDVQGFEVEAIRGAQGLLKAGAVRFLASEMEPHTLRANGMTARGYCNILRESGFQLIDGYGQVRDWDGYCNPFDLDENIDKIDNFWAKYVKS